MADNKCVYCNPEDDDWTTPTFPIDLGVLGEWALSLNVCEGKIQLQIDDDGCGRTICTEDIKIKYCPFCGREMKNPKYLMSTSQGS